MKKLKIRMRLTDECLGMTPPNPKILTEYIASKAPDALSREEELEAAGLPSDPAVEEMVNRETTIFPKLEDGRPFFWDYQIRGFMKDQCGMLSRSEGTLSSSLVAFRKIIDGLVFVRPRKIPLILPEGGTMGSCHRVIRINSATGERTAITSSETVPAGTELEFEIHYMPLKDKAPKAPKKDKKGAEKEAKAPAASKADLAAVIREWFEHGEYRGLGQWRNSGKGAFTVISIEES
jgi:hypothetical protein